MATLVALSATSLVVVLPAAAAGGQRLERICAGTPTVLAAAVPQRFTLDTDTVVLARADSYANALAGAPLARLRKAPILLVDRYAPLPDVVFNGSTDWTRRG